MGFERSIWLTVLLNKCALKQKVIVQIIYLFNTLAYKKYQITISQFNINRKINEPKPMGQNIGAKFCIFITRLFNLTPLDAILNSPKRNLTTRC